MKKITKKILIISVYLNLVEFLLARIMVNNINSIPESAYSVFYILIIITIYSTVLSSIILAFLFVKSKIKR